MQAVMIILGQEASWPSAKLALSTTDFIQRIKGYDKDKITNKQLRQIEKYTRRITSSQKNYECVDSSWKTVYVGVH